MRIGSKDLKIKKKVATLKLYPVEKDFGLHDSMGCKDEVIALNILLGGFNPHRNKLKDPKFLLDKLPDLRMKLSNILYVVTEELK